MARAELRDYQGKVKWTWTKKLNKYNKWTCTLYPNPESLEKLRELQAEGIKNIMKKDEDGYYMVFSRPPEITLRDGRKQILDPPVVVDQDDHYLSEMIGNGSDCTVRLEVYGGTHQASGNKYKAARLFGIKVHNLIPYKPSESDDKYMIKATKDMPQTVKGW